MGAACLSAFWGCSKMSSSESQSNSTIASDQDKLKACQSASWKKIHESMARDPATDRACLKRTEDEFRASGKMPKYLDCGRQSYILRDREILARLCTDEIPRECGIGPEVVQEAITREHLACAKLYTGTLTPIQQCLKNEEAKAHANGSLPTRLSCGAQVVGSEDQKLLAQKCDDFLHACDPSLKNFDPSGFVQNSKGQNVDVSVANNPPCAPDRRGRYNADCSVVHTSHGVYQLTTFQRCIDRKQVELQKPGGAFNVGGRKLDCGMMTIQNTDKIVTERECIRITDECIIEVPNRLNEQMKKLDVPPQL
jgi:hypothetical protein